MTVAPEILPEFDAPPVVEVILAVGFEPAYRLSNIDLMEVWHDLFKQRFPVAAEQPHYSVPRETFENIQVPQMELITRAGPPPIRLWLTTEDEGELIQLQHDWFARNWRKVGSGSEYPRYESHILPAFEKDFDGFASYLKSKGLELRSTQCEITYLNRITANRVWNNHGEFFKMFRIFDNSSYETLPVESLAYRSSLLIYGADNNPVGRLYMQIESMYDEEGAPALMFNLTARGAPIAGNDMKGIIGFFDLAHVCIVRSFVKVTSEKAHLEWRRTR